MNDSAPFGCPACGFTSDSEEDVKNHMAEMANDPKHQEYDLKMQDEENDDMDSDTSENA